MGELDHGPVRFDASDVSPAVALLRKHSTPSNDITAWIDVRPLDVPTERLPMKKGLLGRSKLTIEQLVSYAVAALGAALGGWQGGFEATGVDIADYGRRVHGL